MGRKISLHEVWPFGWFTIPLKTDSEVHYRQCQINLEVVMARLDIQKLFPLFLANVTLDKKTHNNIRCVDHPVQCSAESCQVVSICADCSQVVRTIPIIFVNDIVISNIIRVCLWRIYSITNTFPPDMPLDCHTHSVQLGCLKNKAPVFRPSRLCITGSTAFDLRLALDMPPKTNLSLID